MKVFIEGVGEFSTKDKIIAFQLDGNVDRNIVAACLLPEETDGGYKETFKKIEEKDFNQKIMLPGLGIFPPEREEAFAKQVNGGEVHVMETTSLDLPALAISPKTEAQINSVFSYHKPKDELTAARCQFLRDEFNLFAKKVAGNVPESRELSLALTHLEIASMEAIAGVVRHQ